MDYTKLTNQDLEQLIEQKDMEATCEMADRCLNGTYGVEQNLNRAYQLYHRAESKGSRRAYVGLAYMYENGILFGQNIELAKKYYEMAGVQKTEFAEVQERKKHYPDQESRFGLAWMDRSLTRSSMRQLARMMWRRMSPDSI